MHHIDRFALVCCAMLALCAGHLTAADDAVTLKIGDPAPALTPTGWLNGEPITAFTPGTIYVVECWATWCGPCKEAIPHVSEMNTRFKGEKVEFIGLDVWENDQTAVAPFVASMGAKMNYRVALDADTINATAWLRAAGQNGIPCSFVVDRAGRVAWIGHPMGGLDGVIDSLTKGTFDIKAEAIKAAAEATERAASEKRMKDIDTRFGAAVAAKDTAAIHALVAENASADAELADRIRYAAFTTFFAQKAYTEAYEFAAELLPGTESETLNEVAWAILDTQGVPQAERKIDLALELATRADELAKHANAQILDTLALAYFESGLKAKAIATEKKAIALAEDKDKQVLEDALARFSAAPASP